MLAKSLQVGRQAWLPSLLITARPPYMVRAPAQ